MKRNILAQTKRGAIAFVALICLCMLDSCMYYKVKNVAKVNSHEASTYESSNKYLIIHQNKEVWHLSKPDIKGDTISGVLAPLSEKRLAYETSKLKQAKRYKKKDSTIVSEVHLYLPDALIPKLRAAENVRFACSAVQRAEVYQKNKVRSTLSAAIPIMIGAPILIGTIVALTKSSCPLVYVENNADSTFNFAGEIFGGAVYPSVERNDYMPLPGFQPMENRYALKITNKLPEIQYVNLAELWTVDHPKDVAVLPDRQGIIHSIVKPEQPLEASSLAKSDLRSLLYNKDQRCFQFDEEPLATADTCAFNTVFLSFTMPHQTETGKLIIRAGNSLWSDYAYGEFTRLFGNKYDEWTKKQAKEPAEKNNQWKQNQRFVLMVYLETSAGWEFVDYFDMIGPLGSRDLIMPINLVHALTTDIPEHGRIIRIKLESGFKFWDLDYAAMDFTRDIQYETHQLQAYSAITETGLDVTQLLMSDDGKYYVQKKIGEEGVLLFEENPVAEGNARSVFLRTKGYYTPVRHYVNSPNYKLLRTFLIPGRFSKFSFESYADFRKNNGILVSEPNVP